MKQENILEMAKDLIAIKSTADNKPGLHAAVNYIADFLATNRNITIERFEKNGIPSFLAYIGQRPSKFDVLFNAHVDVVAGKPHNFIAKTEGDKLYGRGAYDMKLSAIIMAVVFFENVQKTHHKIGLQIVSDEEIGGINGAYYQLNQIDIKVDLVISGEMTDLEICNETRGVCWAQVDFIGSQAHSAYAWDGKNALAQASDFVQKLLQDTPVPQTKKWVTTANISSISTQNTTYNLVPDNAQVLIDFRFIPEDLRFKTIDSVKNYIMSLAPNCYNAEVKLHSPAIEVPINNKSLQKLMAAYQKTTKSPAKLIKRYGSSDARHFAEFGQHCVEFGPSGFGLHSDNEYALISSIKPYKNTLERFIYL